MARASLRPSLRPSQGAAPTRSVPPERVVLRSVPPRSSVRTPSLNEDLWFGTSTDDAAERRAAQSLAAKVGRILGAKPFPEAARRLDELTRGVSCPVDEVVRVLEADPALSARLLRLVNSAGYALRIRCTSVRHATVLVGTRRLNQLATTAAVLDLFESSTRAAAQLVEHSALVGSLCRYLAVHLGLPRDELATCGFLHDIGKLMLLETEEERYAEMLREHRGAFDSIHGHERQAFGFDHAVLGAHVLAAWNIPDPVPKVVAWHHQPARALQVGGMVSSMVQALRLADALAYALEREPRHDAIPRLAASEMATFLEVSEPQLAQMWSDFEGLYHAARTRGRAPADPDLVPRRPSFEPRSTRPSKTVTQVPKHFACGVCQLASYGTTCTACGMFVCPEHWAASEQWCTDCLERYRAVVAESLWGTALITAGVAGGSAGSAALLSGASAGPALGVAALSSLLSATLVLAGGRALKRWRFLRDRAEARRAASSAPTEVVERIEVPPLPDVTSLAHLPGHGGRDDAPVPAQALGLLPLDDPRRSAVTDPAPAPDPGPAPGTPADPALAETLLGITPPVFRGERDAAQAAADPAPSGAPALEPGVGAAATHLAAPEAVAHAAPTDVPRTELPDTAGAPHAIAPEGVAHSAATDVPRTELPATAGVAPAPPLDPCDGAGRAADASPPPETSTPPSSAPPSSGERPSTRAAPREPDEGVADAHELPGGAPDPAPVEERGESPAGVPGRVVPEPAWVQPLALPTLEQLSEPPPPRLAPAWSSSGDPSQRVACAPAQERWFPCSAPA